ncbi:MAG: PrsW family intramembrane metalloprotease [Melioribacteraceae bacterium]|nr:PrsW family intramembrane metalloprotease [Melioribacteraceae bacterium]
MSFTASLFAAVIPMALYLILIWRLDRYEREPFGKVVKHFLWGAIGAVVFALIFSSILAFGTNLFISSVSLNSFIAAVIIAPFAEELVKSAYLFHTYTNNYFDNLTDGLVYGGAIGLGFGMTENLLYFSMYNETFSQWITIVITRSIFSAVMHGIATATVGAFLAKAKFSLSANRKKYPIIGLVLAMFFHATWNFSLTFEFTYMIGILFMVILISSFFIIFYSSLRNENNIIQNELDSEQLFLNQIYLDNSNPMTLKYLVKSFNTNSQRKLLLNFATKLAFRKLQAKNSAGIQKEIYVADIDIIENKITQLIEDNKV